jgi:hypothetical protein
LPRRICRHVLMPWTAHFDTASLRAFYGSQINVRRRPAGEQRNLLDALEVTARGDFDGHVARAFVTVVYTGRRPARPSPAAGFVRSDVATLSDWPAWAAQGLVSTPRD